MSSLSDSEDDYMSDSLLSGCLKEDVRPGLLFNKNQKRKHELYLKQQEEKTKKSKSYHDQEKETREKGLNTAISSENKGFKLLEKMGYKAGVGIGKTVTGITEPVAVQLKEGTSGVGHEKHLKHVQQQKVELKTKAFEDKQTEFFTAHAERRSLATLKKDFIKAQRICEELDLKEGKKTPDTPFFWSKQTKDSLKKKTESDDDEESSEENEDDICEPKLCDIILYLRKKYFYCLYCGDFIQDQQGCPGYFRKDHDE